MSRNMERPEASREIYIATDALPLPMEDVNFLQGYPIWINNPYHSLKVKDEDGWRYHAPQEPYKILLPPYEPVIVVEDARRKFLPFFTDAFFTDLFNKETLMPLPEVAAADTGESRTDTSTIVNDKTANYTNDSKIIETENIKTNHSHDSSNDHANFPMTEKTNIASPSTRNKEMDNYYDDYEWKPWFVIHDYPERNEPQSSHERGSKSSIADLATDDLYGNDTSADAETSARSQIADEERSRVSEIQYVDGRDKSLATLGPSASTDYDARNFEKFYNLGNYPRDAMSVRHVGKSSRDHLRSEEPRTFR